MSTLVHQLASYGANTYTYDVENRLIAVSGARTASLSYDPLGRLFETSNAPLGAGGNITRFQYDGDALVAEYGAGHNLLRRYMHGANADEVILWDEGDRMDCSGTRFLHWDAAIALMPHWCPAERQVISNLS